MKKGLKHTAFIALLSIVAFVVFYACFGYTLTGGSWRPPEGIQIPIHATAKFIKQILFFAPMYAISGFSRDRLDSLLLLYAALVSLLHGTILYAAFLGVVRLRRRTNKKTEPNKTFEFTSL